MINDEGMKVKDHCDLNLTAHADFIRDVIPSLDERTLYYKNFPKVFTSGLEPLKKTHPSNICNDDIEDMYKEPTHLTKIAD